MNSYNLFLSIIPGIIICLYIYFKDKHEKEPFSLLVINFLFGIISVVFLPKIYSYTDPIFNFSSTNFLISLISCIVGIGLIEEFCKFIFVRFITYYFKDFNEPMDGVVYCVMVSMGFATVENIMHVANSGSDGEAVAMARMFSSVPAHAICAIIMGYYIGIQKFKKKKGIAVKGLIWASIFHGLYDAFLFSNSVSEELATFLMIILFIVSFEICLRIIEKHLDDSPFKPKFKKNPKHH